MGDEADDVNDRITIGGFSNYEHWERSHTWLASQRFSSEGQLKEDWIDWRMEHIRGVPPSIDEYTSNDIKAKFQFLMGLERIDETDKTGENRPSIDPSQPSYKVDNAGFDVRTLWIRESDDLPVIFQRAPAALNQFIKAASKALRIQLSRFRSVSSDVILNDDQLMGAQETKRNLAKAKNLLSAAVNCHADLAAQFLSIQHEERSANFPAYFTQMAGSNWAAKTKSMITQVSSELAGQGGINEMMSRFNSLRVANEEEHRRLDPGEKLLRPLYSVDKVKPPQASLSMPLEEWKAWPTRARAYFDQQRLSTQDNVIQDTFIAELYEKKFWQSIKEEQERQSPSNGGPPVYLGWATSLKYATTVYERVNDCTNPVTRYASIVNNTLTQLTNPKAYTFKVTEGQVSEAIVSYQRVVKEIGRIPEKIKENPEIMSASLFLSLTDPKTRERMKKEMAKSNYDDEEEISLKVGYDVEARKVLYPDSKLIFKVLYELEQEQNSEKSYSSTWKDKKQIHNNAMETREPSDHSRSRRRDSDSGTHRRSNSFSRGPCFRCAGDHFKRDCDVKEVNCTLCKSKNHVDQMCHKTRKKEQNMMVSSSRSRSRSNSRGSSTGRGPKDKKRGKKRQSSRSSATSASRSRSRSTGRKSTKSKKPAKGKHRRNSQAALLVESTLTSAESGTEVSESESDQEEEPRKRKPQGRSKTPAPSADRKDSRRSGAGSSRHARKAPEISCFVAVTDKRGEEAAFDISDLPKLSILVWNNDPSPSPDGKTRKKRDFFGSGMPALALADTGCSHPLVSPEFASRMKLRTLPFADVHDTPTCMVGDGNEVTPLAFTDFWINTERSSKNPRRKIKAYVLKGLPHDILIGKRTLIGLGLLDKKWPNIKPEDMSSCKPRKKFKYSEEERVAHCYLMSEGRRDSVTEELSPDTDGYDTEEFEPEPPTLQLDEEHLIKAKAFVPDELFDMQTDYEMIPGFKTGELDEDFVEVIRRYPTVFSKAIDRDHHTDSPPITFPLKDIDDPINPRPKVFRSTKCRLTPQHMRAKWAQMLDKLEKDGIIIRVQPGEPPSEYLSNAFLVPKPHSTDGAVRMVCDYSKLKHIFRRTPAKQDSPKKILGNLRPGCRYYFCADMSSGYWQMRLAPGPEGQDITQFICDRGSYKWARMPMGIQTASDELAIQLQKYFQELFQPVSDEPSAGSPMVRDVDDFLGAAPTKSEFVKLLDRFLAICDSMGVYLNPSKFRFASPEGPDTSIVFAGIRVGSNGTLAVDPKRMDAIREYPLPETKKQLERWLGLITSLGTFAPTPLTFLLTKQRELNRRTRGNFVQWNLFPEAETEFFEARKRCADHESILHEFDPTFDTGLMTDVAKCTGLGLFLFQHTAGIPLDEIDPRTGRLNFQLLGIWSISAKPSWRNLSPLETEILGFFQASVKLHYEIAGAPVIHGYVDHKPFMQAYNSKEMKDLSPRMLKLMQELLELPFVMHYLSNKTQLIKAVDALSRAPVYPSSVLTRDPADMQHHPMHCNTMQCMMAAVPGVDTEYCASDPALQPMFKHASEDQFYVELVKTVEENEASWDTMHTVPRDTEARQFLHRHRTQWELMSTITNSEGQKLIQINGEQLYVPLALRESIMDRMDQSHNGSKRAIYLFQRSYWWEGFRNDVIEHCRRCVACRAWRRKPPREPCINTSPPPCCGHTMGVDFITVKDDQRKSCKYMVLVDYLSGWSTYFFFAKPPTGKSVASRLTTWFHANTWPRILATDGERNLSRGDLRRWMTNNGIVHRLSSAKHQQSNGQAENSCKIFRNLWRKCKMTHPDLSPTNMEPFERAWAMYLDTPQQRGQLSPSRLWFGRTIRHPHWFTPVESSDRDSLTAAQLQFAIRKDKSSKTERPDHPRFKTHPKPLTLTVNQRVLMADSRGAKTIKGTVISVGVTGRSAIVQDLKGDTYLRNRCFLAADDEVAPLVVATHAQGDPPPGILRRDPDPEPGPDQEQDHPAPAPTGAAPKRRVPPSNQGRWTRSKMLRFNPRVRNARFPTRKSVRRKGGKNVVVTKNTSRGPYLEVNDDVPLNDSPETLSNAYVAPDPHHPSYSIEAQPGPDREQQDQSQDSDPREEGELVPDEFCGFREEHEDGPEDQDSEEYATTDQQDSAPPAFDPWWDAIPDQDQPHPLDLDPLAPAPEPEEEDEVEPGQIERKTEEEEQAMPEGPQEETAPLVKIQSQPPPQIQGKKKRKRRTMAELGGLEEGEVPRGSKGGIPLKQRLPALSPPPIAHKVKQAKKKKRISCLHIRVSQRLPATPVSSHSSPYQGGHTAAPTAACSSPADLGHGRPQDHSDPQVHLFPRGGDSDRGVSGDHLTGHLLQGRDDRLHRPGQRPGQLIRRPLLHDSCPQPATGPSGVQVEHDHMVLHRRAGPDRCDPGLLLLQAPLTLAGDLQHQEEVRTHRPTASPTESRHDLSGSPPN